MNMKKFLTVLVLGLVVFAVSCSDESSFKKAVGGNTYNVDGMSITFSSDGSTGTTSVDGILAYTLSFVSAESSTKATYTFSYNDPDAGYVTSTVIFTISGSTLTVSW